jgi:low affinity Fe/Cu permease
MPTLPRRRFNTKELQMKDIFRLFSEKAAHAVGSYWAFLAALATVALWALTGPYFGYSDTWQLFINTGTTIVTFLMVFLIQNTQNRDARIVTLKLDELLRSVEGARTGMVELDHMSDEDLEHVHKEFERLREKYAPLVDDDLAHVAREIHTRKRRR